MTNAMIIFNESQRLAEDGIIQYTGKTFRMVDPEGNEVEFRETEAIHTYNAWKELGYQVQKGQKAVAQFTIWKFAAGKKSEAEEEGQTVDANGRMFMKKASFFAASQVKAIEA